MLSAERKRNILKYIQKKPAVTVTELAEVFEVSAVTIRKVLNELSREGQIERTHGGAMSVDLSRYEEKELKKEVVNIDLKRQIAEKAIRFVENGNSIIMDAGSTTMELAKLIVERKVKDLTIITNAFNIADIFRENKEYDLIFMGGQYRNGILSCVGPLTIDGLRRLHADKCFIGANGVSVDYGYTTPNMLEAEVKRTAMSRSRESFALVDSSKFGNVFLSHVAGISEIDFMITDNKLPKDMENKILSAGVNLR